MGNRSRRHCWKTDYNTSEEWGTTFMTVPISRATGPWKYLKPQGSQGDHRSNRLCDKPLRLPAAGGRVRRGSFYFLWSVGSAPYCCSQEPVGVVWGKQGTLSIKRLELIKYEIPFFTVSTSSFPLFPIKNKRKLRRKEAELSKVLSSPNFKSRILATDQTLLETDCLGRT